MILWGPPGSGKTTMARMVARYCDAEFEVLSAVTAGIKDVRDVVARAKSSAKRRVLFVDEVHRFNKAQQDGFLPHVEDGTLILIGATTENPAFELNNALLSRMRVYVLKALEPDDLKSLLERALQDAECGLGQTPMHLSEHAKSCFIATADGDARRLRNFLEIASQFSRSTSDGLELPDSAISDVIGTPMRRFDNKGDIFYDQISALHKSVRGTDPDATLYWFCRMIDGGCEPRYIARRIIRMASEDIGNADPRGLTLALDAAEAYERLGSPEGSWRWLRLLFILPVRRRVTQCTWATRLLCRPPLRPDRKEVPVHLRNAPTRLAKELGHGQGYRYAHDEPDAYASGETYLPDSLINAQFYQPVERGLEIKIREKLARLRGETKSSDSE